MPNSFRNSSSMSLPLWDVRHDCDLAGDRDRVVDELKRRDAARDRERESETQRLRPTFLVRSSTKGVKISSWAHGTVRHVPIAVDDNDWHSLPSGARAPSLEKLLVAIGYIDESNTDDDGEAEKHQYIALDELDRQQHAEQYAPPPFSKLQWQISDSDLTLDELPIAAGSFGQVFRGRLAPSGALVAVKVCKAKETLAAKAQTDFVNELSILRSLSAHENVVRFFGAVLDEASGAPVRLVLQFCSGGSLLTAIESKTWDGWRTSTKLRLLTGVARGLEHLHAHGVIHRDLAARKRADRRDSRTKGRMVDKSDRFRHGTRRGQRAGGRDDDERRWSVGVDGA
jgi:hypothetical protein